MKYLYLYLIAVIVFFAIDMIWLGWVAKDLYWKRLDHLMAENVNWPAAFIFYLLYIGGILYFAILPGYRDADWQVALLNGALFGFFCYATYDLTNLATLKEWPIVIVIVDIIWGTVLTGSTAVASFLLGQKFLNL